VNNYNPRISSNRKHIRANARYVENKPIETDYHQKKIKEHVRKENKAFSQDFHMESRPILM